MITKDKLEKMELKKLVELKDIVNSISNDYANNLTDYALMSGNNMLSNIPSDKLEAYKLRKEFNDASTLLQEVITEKLKKILCLES